jgi:N-acetylglucosaminyldiphosphoundecaprenol N-acetyl-beta-D-mannosaminyltransferase
MSLVGKDGHTEEIAGFGVCTDSIELCVARIEDWIKGTVEQRYFVCANPHSLVCAKTDLVFSQAIRNADLVTPDGFGIVLASRILGGVISGRITGYDIFKGVTRQLNGRAASRVFFLGSTDEVLLNIRDRLAVDFPNVEVVGTYSPPFRNEFSEQENQEMVDAINKVNPDVLWVGMTAPKQEKWIYEHRKRLNVKFIGAIGAVFDFYSGNVKRSHPVFQNLGLEWLPRLIRQPRKLWKRNFVSTPLFLWTVFRERFSFR